MLQEQYILEKILTILPVRREFGFKKRNLGRFSMGQESLKTVPIQASRWPNNLGTNKRRHTMKRILAVVAIIGLFSSVVFAGPVTTYQVTGPVLEVTSD